MRQVNYDTYREKKAPELFQKRIEMRRMMHKRIPRQRFRDPAETRLLGQLIDARFRRLFSSGELEQVAPRKWRWHFVEFHHPSVQEKS